MGERVNKKCPKCGADTIIYRGSSVVHTDQDSRIVVLGNRPSVIEYPCGKCGSRDNVVYCCDKCMQFLCKKCVGEGGCFIATACFGSYDSPQVNVLRRFRDGTLASLPLGRSFINWYYKHSPPVAAFLLRHPFASCFVKHVWLCPVAYILSRMHYNNPTNAPLEPFQ